MNDYEVNRVSDDLVLVSYAGCVVIDRTEYAKLISGLTQIMEQQNND